jgi:hypothetical protein
MSHFTVLVIGDNPEKQLAPFKEDLYDNTNPNGKWDWYSLGGRWSDFFKIKNKETCLDCALKKDIDFEGMKAEGFSPTFAVLNNGKWYESGSMGWWGIVSNEDISWDSKFQELLASIPDDTLLSVYDCNI